MQKVSITPDATLWAELAKCRHENFCSPFLRVASVESTRTYEKLVAKKVKDTPLVSDLPHPVQLQCHELYHRSETGPSRLLAHVHETNFHHCFVAFTLLILLNVSLRHFYTIRLLIYIVRRP